MKIFTVIISMIFLSGLLLSCEEDAEIEPVPQQVDEFTLKGANTGDLNMGMNGKSTGVDQWGLNLQARNFHGYLINMFMTDPLFKNMPHYNHPPYEGEGMSYWETLTGEYPYFVNFMPPGLLDCQLNSQWNDALMSRNGIYPATWVDTNAQITFRYSYQEGDQKWMQLRRLVAVKSNYTLDNGYWYDASGNEVGLASYYWPTLMIVFVENHGNNPFVPWAMPNEYISPNGAGYGKYHVK